MSDSEHHTQFLDHHVVDPSGEAIGKIEDVIFDAETGAPKWAVVKPGLLHRSHYVPLTGASHDADGNVSIPFTKDAVTHAPVAPSEHVLSVEDEQALQEHYGRSSDATAG